jgi:trimethylamine--corrinoid protein Co-methyltransferase
VSGEANKTTFRILSDEQIKLIHESTLVILEEIGVQVRHKETVRMLEGAGARKCADSVVRIPSKIVEGALGTSPKSIEICDREGNPCMVLDGRQTYYGAPSDSFFILDHETGKKRLFLLRDVDICFLANEADSCHDIINFCIRFSGGEENLRSSPFVFHYSEPISPLIHAEEGIQKVLLCADFHIPLVYMPYCLMGGTSPVTIAGALAQCNAEVLSGLVIQQLRNPEAPFIYGTMPAPIDMRTTTGLYGAPELHLAVAASREMARHYGLPFFGTAGTSDSKHLDYQGVMEAVMSCLLTGFSGPDLAHDVGFIDHSNIISPELIVLTNEIIGMTRPLTQGITVTEETLAVDVIRKVGLKKRGFIEEGHTYNHFREFWYPELLDRSMEDETPESREKVREKLRRILRDHKVEPLENQILKDLENLVSRERFSL